MEYLFESINNYIGIIFYSIFIGYVTFIWINTNAFYEYTKLILKPLGIFKGYESFKTERNLALTFVEYLETSKDSFCYKVITCPLCLTFWASMILFLSKEGIAAAFFSYLAYKLLAK
jgi:hypothetical protein